MVRRLIVGLLLGCVLGGLLAAGLVAGLKWTTFTGAGGALLAYLSAAVTGVLTGLVAGKPIWVSGARVEAGLKAFFGALIAFGVMFALRRWATWPLDLHGFGAGGPAAVGQLPAVALPLIGGVLGALFELDNTADPTPKDGHATAAPRHRVAVEGAGGRGKRRSADAEEAASGPEAEIVSPRAKR